MGAAATVATFLAQVLGGAGGDKVVKALWTLTTPLDVTFSQVLTQGAFNTVNVPTGTTIVVIIPPTTNAQVPTLKGVTGDTGIAISPSTPTVIALNGQTSFGIALAAGSNQTVEFACL